MTPLVRHTADSKEFAVLRLIEDFYELLPLYVRSYLLPNVGTLHKSRIVRMVDLHELITQSSTLSERRLSWVTSIDCIEASSHANLIQTLKVGEPRCAIITW
jgi:hypothetical protein